MTTPLSKRYEKDGFAALLSKGNTNVPAVFSVKANQTYNATGLTVVFAETEAALLALIAAKGYTIVPLS
jgi:hypothetical protein